MQTEVGYIITGRGRLTPDDDEAIRFAGGDTSFLEASTEGLREADATMRRFM